MLSFFRLPHTANSPLYLLHFSTSSAFLLQKDERALPGNLQKTKHSWFPPSLLINNNKRNASQYNSPHPWPFLRFKSLKGQWSSCSNRNTSVFCVLCCVCIVVNVREVPTAANKAEHIVPNFVPGSQTKNVLCIGRISATSHLLIVAVRGTAVSDTVHPMFQFCCCQWTETLCIWDALHAAFDIVGQVPPLWRKLLLGLLDTLDPWRWNR